MQCYGAASVVVHQTDMSESIFSSDTPLIKCVEILRDLYRLLDGSKPDDVGNLKACILQYLTVSNNAWEQRFTLMYPGRLEHLQLHGNIEMLKTFIRSKNSLSEMHPLLFDASVRRYYRLDDAQLEALVVDLSHLVGMDVDNEDKQMVSGQCHALCADVFTPFAKTLQNQGDPCFGSIHANVADDGLSLTLKYFDITSGVPTLTNYFTITPLDTQQRRYNFVMPHVGHFGPNQTFLAKLRDLVKKDIPNHGLEFRGTHQNTQKTVSIRRYIQDELPIPVEVIRLVFLNINLIWYGLV